MREFFARIDHQGFHIACKPGGVSVAARLELIHDKLNLALKFINEIDIIMSDLPG